MPPVRKLFQTEHWTCLSQLISISCFIHAFQSHSSAAWLPADHAVIFIQVNKAALITRHFPPSLLIHSRQRTRCHSSLWSPPMVLELVVLLSLIKSSVRACVCWRGISSPSSNGFFELPQRAKLFSPNLTMSFCYKWSVPWVKCCWLIELQFNVKQVLITFCNILEVLLKQVNVDA